MYQKFTLSSAIVLSLLTSSSVFAARPIDLSHQEVKSLKPMLVAGLMPTGKANKLEEMSRSTDFNQTTHIRVQETYAGYPVWGGDAVVHVKNMTNSKQPLAGLIANSQATSMSGTIYQELDNDLRTTPATALTKAQADKAVNQAISLAAKKYGEASSIEALTSRLMVYIDDDNKAHWAYLVSFQLNSTTGKLPAIPTFILDANSLSVYKSWNDLQTLTEATGGGLGGNQKMGKLIYDGANEHLAALSVERDPEKKICYLQNARAWVKDVRTKALISYPCEVTSQDHNAVYWNNQHEEVNGGYSPSNDALFAGEVVINLYKDWYHVPALQERDGKPMMLKMFVHERVENAYWNNKKNDMTFGDGENIFYPLTSLSVTAHEVSHGFTAQHSNLSYDNSVSGGINESFSDMAAQAAEVYATHKNSWQIGPEIFKEEGAALRYMDQPSLDCRGGTPGGTANDPCSVDTIKQFETFNATSGSQMDVHFSSGIFNRAFYLIATSPGWDVRKAFDVMVQANSHYWVSRLTFTQAAEGVVSATKDYHYDVETVRKAFDQVGIKV